MRGKRLDRLPGSASRSKNLAHTDPDDSHLNASFPQEKWRFFIVCRSLETEVSRSGYSEAETIFMGRAFPMKVLVPEPGRNVL